MYLPHDAHCHIDSITNINQQQNQAVASIIPQDIIKLAKLREKHINIKIGIGLHPWFIDNFTSCEQLETELSNLIEKYQPNFIGECGLDKLKPNYAKQILFTQSHCKLAQKYNLPIVFHCVTSYNDLLQILSKYPINKGLLHAYNANDIIAQQLIKKNIQLGIGGIIIKQNSKLEKFIRKLPIENILIESDAPYMPIKGNKTSSSQDCYIYFQHLCKIKQLNPATTLEVINQNWLNLYA